MKANSQKRRESHAALSDFQLGRLKELFEEGLDLPSESRESFIREVLSRQDPPPHQEIWMLRQPDKVRHSFVREVLEAA